MWRIARGTSPGGEARNVTLLKGVVFLGLAAALFAAKIWPLAFMTLVAAGAITGIELWRDRTIKLEEAAEKGARTPRVAMQPEEASSILGLSVDAAPEDIRAAHKKLISQLHPDKGGTDYLAAKINDARDVLMKRNEVVKPPSPTRGDPNQTPSS
ncbi:MAG: DnaJ domain-containing protein [Parvularculaceae bacterium]